MGQRYLVHVSDDCPYFSTMSPLWRIVDMDEAPRVGAEETFGCSRADTDIVDPDYENDPGTCGSCDGTKTIKILAVEPYSDERAKELKLDPEVVRKSPF